MSNFPKLHSFPNAYDIAQVILDGFEKDNRIFRETSFHAKKNFESQNWQGIRKLIAANIVPESYCTFLVMVVRINAYFMKLRANFFNPQTRKNLQNLIKDDRPPDYFGDPDQPRFVHRYPSNRTL
jgi:isocitrate dehydrogenase kinase/phosphatase